MSDKPINLHLPGINAPSNLQATFLAHGTDGGLTAHYASVSYHKDLPKGAFFGGSASHSGVSGYGQSMGGGNINAYVGFNFLANK